MQENLNTPKTLDPVSCHRLAVQGYGRFSASELADLRFGIRFPYVFCGIIAAIGIFSVNIPIIIFVTVIAFFGALLPNHPFDYLYNYGVRHLLNKPKVPPRSPQNRFACGIATVWLALTLILFYLNYTVIGMVWGAMMLPIVLLVSAADICIPSMVYNWINKIKI